MQLPVQEIRILVNTRTKWNLILLILRSPFFLSFREIFLLHRIVQIPLISSRTLKRHCECSNVGRDHKSPVLNTSSLLEKIHLWLEHTCWTGLSAMVLYLSNSHSAISSPKKDINTQDRCKGIAPDSDVLNSDALTGWPVRPILTSKALFGRGPFSGLSKAGHGGISHTEHLRSTILSY